MNALEAEGLHTFYGKSHILHGVGLAVGAGEIVTLLGRNGAGKTTLLRSLLVNAPGADDEPFTIDGGTVEWGHEVAVGYFAQDHRASIQPGMTILDWLQQFDPTAGTEELRGLLGQMLFARDEAMKPTQALSGGEAARLLFCKLMLQKPNVLALDEPTNHLDLESINALNFALQKYEGTIFLVTHDHDLLEETATRIWRMDGNAIEDFRGAYEEYQSAVA